MPRCENEACGRTYKQVRKWQRFCKPKCRQAARNREQAEATVEPSAIQVIEAAMAWNQCGGTLVAGLVLRQACDAHHVAVAEGEDVGP